jgi:hypothetical protein
MRQYQVETNFVSIKYKIGDIISDKDLRETNIALKEVSKKFLRIQKQRKNRKI